MERVWVGWTTAPSREKAETLARNSIQTGVAACAQVDGPISSYYHWENEIHEDQEFRITFKFPEQNQLEIEQWLHEEHPYDLPQWLAWPCELASKDYQAWVSGQNKDNK